MKNLFLFVVLICFCSNVFSEDKPIVRPTMTYNEDETLIKDLLSNLENSMNENNLRNYLSCFTSEYANKHRKDAAVMFVEHTLSLKFDNFQILESDDKKIEFVAKYTTNYSGDNVTTIANILAEKEDKKLVVANQQVISQKGENLEKVMDCKDGKCTIDNGCKDGRCAIDNAPKKKKTFSLFNDANGNPDPNGIMWIDPRVIIEASPEEFQCKGCMR